MIKQTLNNAALKPAKANHADWFASSPKGHLVQFYSSESALLLPLHDYISNGLANGDTCIVIATSAHLRALDEQLTESRVNILEARARAQYQVFDAADTLEKFMVNNLPNRALFFSTIGSIISKATGSGNSVRAYGEMVALLWQQGNKQAVIDLENLWNELVEMYSFSLYCAYAELHFIMNIDEQAEIQGCHSLHVLTA